VAYIDYTYYTEIFGGEPVPEEEFPALARQASDIIDALSIRSPDAESKLVKQAACYQVEYLCQSGGIAGVVASESLGSYSISREAGSLRSIGGIPISPLCIAKLEAAGLRARWI